MPWNFLKAQMGILTFVLFIWWVIKYKSVIISKLKSIIEFKPLFLLIMFIVYSYISILWSSSVEDGLDHVNKFHKYYIFIILPLFLTLNEKEAFSSIKVLIVSVGFYAIFSLSIFSANNCACLGVAPPFPPT